MPDDQAMQNAGTTTNSPSKPQEPQQQATPAQSTNEAGNVIPASPAARDGPQRVLLSPTGQPLARDSKGRLYNPAKGPPEPASRTMSYASEKVANPNPVADNDLERNPGIHGLDAIPKGWPHLPSNVSLSQEIAWVQGERLLVVKETPSRGIKVDLSKARVPAPSMSALSWLETSIRSYAKFVEVASKQASSGQDEAEFVRRERMQVGEIRSILEEMRVDKKS